MARRLKKHLKSQWAEVLMLDKLGGAFAPKPSFGPHKSREWLHWLLSSGTGWNMFLHTMRSSLSWCNGKLWLMGKLRTDRIYQDVVSIPKTNVNFRLPYGTKRLFHLHSLRNKQARFKLCKVWSVQFGWRGSWEDGSSITYKLQLLKRLGWALYKFYTLGHVSPCLEISILFEMLHFNMCTQYCCTYPFFCGKKVDCVKMIKKYTSKIFRCVWIWFQSVCIYYTS